MITPAARPQTPQRGAARLLRGWTAAAVATLLAAGSHTVAGLASAPHDAGPHPVVWILTLALAGPLCTALAGRALSWGRLLGAVGSSQVLFHWLYSMASAPPGAGEAAALVRLRAADAHAAHTGSAAQAPVPGTSGPVVHAGIPTDPVLVADHASLAMTAAHVLSAVVTVVLLHRGEALAARVVELAAGVVLRSPGARLVHWTPQVRLPRLPSRPLVPVLRTGAVVSSRLRLRGPPVPAISL